MSERWTDVRRGYGGGVSPDAKRLSAIAGRLEDLGNLAIKKFTSESPDGITIVKRFGMFERQKYYPTPIVSVPVAPVVPGNVWVVGSNAYGCLGIGQGYSTTTYLWGTEGAGTGSHISYEWNRTPYPLGYWGYGGHQDYNPNLISLGLQWAYYIDNEYFSNLDPPVLIKGIPCTSAWLSHFTFDIPYVPWAPASGGSYPVYVYSWPIVQRPRPISFTNAIWTSIDPASGCSFIINNKHEMFCCGGNINGTLGIGKAMGYWTPETGNPGILSINVPNYYTTVFTQVPGSWKQVHTWGGVTQALKTDGTLWGAGIGWANYGNTFVQVGTDTNWVGIGIKDIGTAYEMWDGGSLTETITKAEWNTLYFGMTVDQVCADREGNGSFIGGSLTDLSNVANEFYSPHKENGTLWANFNNTIFYQEQTGNTWIFTAGLPTVNFQTSEVTGGGQIAIKAA